MRRSDRGFTLLELLVVVVVLGTTLAAVGTTLASTHRADRACESRALDLVGLGRALAALEGDLRESTDVRVESPVRLLLTTTRGAVEYRVLEGALERVAGGRVSPLARDMLDLRVTREGPLVRATIRLARERLPGKRKAEATTLVAPRAWREGR
jgi:prepilin-type N-terminal cleavage/methylation domain-containing protein